MSEENYKIANQRNGQIDSVSASQGVNYLVPDSREENEEEKMTC